MASLINKKVLLEEIQDCYDLNFGEALIDPKEFYNMVDYQRPVNYKEMMKAEKRIRILAQLLETKTELQEQALSRTGASKRMCLAQIKGIDRALEIIKKETEDDV